MLLALFILLWISLWLTAYYYSLSRRVRNTTTKNELLYAVSGLQVERGSIASAGEEVVSLLQSQATRDGGVFMCEKDFVEKFPYWNNYCLDTTYFGIDSLRILRRLSKNWSYYHDYVDKYSESLNEFILSHYDKKANGFSNHRDSFASLYGTYFALALPFLNEGHCNLSSCYVQNWEVPFSNYDYRIYFNGLKKEAVRNFIMSCFHEKTGGFSDTPYKEPSIMCTDAGVLLLLNYLNSNKSDNKENEVPNNLQSDRIASFIWSRASEEDGSLGFSDSAQSLFSTSCSVRLALRVLDLCEVQREKLPALQQTILFLKSCKVNQGWSWAPSGKVESSLFMDLVLRAFIKLNKMKIITKSEIRELFPVDESLDYLLSLAKNRILGFDVHSPSNIYSLRCIIRIVLSLSEINSENVSDYKLIFSDRQIEKIDLIQSIVVPELYSFMDKRRGIFRGYN